MKILTVVGARPQFIKAAPVCRAIALQNDITQVMIHTGQHYDSNMSDVFFEELGISAPKYNLGIGGGGHGAMTARMLEGIESVLLDERPDWVLVYGDTNSTLAGGLAAAKLHIPVAHVEAGLRSFNRKMPEEINRVLTDHLSTYLFCPTDTAVKNLHREGITDSVEHVGDVMFDATIEATQRAKKNNVSILDHLGLSPNNYSLATVHRAENTDDPEQLRLILAFLQTKAQERTVVLPLHPRTRKAASNFGIEFNGLMVIPPVGYLDMALLMDGCVEILTDSGGIQKEAYFHRKPCITLRTETEWVETIENGWNRLWTDPSYRRPRCDISDYGDGQAAQKILRSLKGKSAD